MKLKAAKKAHHRVTAEAVAAFRAGDDGALRRALGLKPWEWPTTPELDEPSPWPSTSAGFEWWPRGQELHRALIAAAAGENGVQH